MGKRKYGEQSDGRRLKLKQSEVAKCRRRVEKEDKYGMSMDSDSIEMDSKQPSCSFERNGTDEDSGSFDSSNRYSRSMSSDSDIRTTPDRKREHQRRCKEKMVDHEPSRRGKKKAIEVTEGYVVKARHAVVRTQAKMCRRPPTVICRVEMFQEKVLKYLDKSRKKEIMEMGFGGFLHLKINHIPRQICYWIMSRVRRSGKIEFGDGEEMKLAPVQVQCVFGLPMGQRAVPTKLNSDDSLMMKRMSEITSEYRLGGRDRDSVSIDKAVAVLTSVEVDEDGTPLPLVTSEEKLRYRTAFLIVILGAILCPLKRWGVLSKKARPAVTIARKADKYDWCTFVYDWVMDCVSVFADKFDEDGFVPGCGGCSLFLLVFYLDHLRRPPVRWGILPRIKVWTQEEVSKAVKEDRRRTSSDYGRLKCVPVAYGEEAHPCSVKDSSTTLVQKVASEVVKLLKPHLQKLVSDTFRNQTDYEGMRHVREKSVRNSPPYSERLMTSGRRSRRFVYYSDDEEAEYTLDKNSSLGVCGYANSLPQNENLNGARPVEGIDVGGNVIGKGGNEGQVDKGGEKDVQQAPDLAEGEYNNKVEAELLKQRVKAVGDSIKKALGPLDHFQEDVDQDSCSTPQQHTPSLKDQHGDHFIEKQVEELGAVRVKEQSSILCDDSSLEGAVHRTKEKRPVKDTSAVGGVGSRYGQSVSSVRQTVLDKRFLDCCRRFKLIKDGGEGIELIQCDKGYATQRDCYGVLMAKEFTSNAYVRMAAALYTKKWELEQFAGKSRRILMSPDFATRTIEVGNDPAHVASQTKRVMPKVAVSEIKVLFVPVLRNEHWWCVAIDLNARTSWIIDSIYTDPWKEHQNDSEKIVQAVDDLLAEMDPQWVKGEMQLWTRRKVEITSPTDHRSCGVIMLACVKACVDRFRAKWGLPEKIEQARMRLLLEDAMSEFNELKAHYDSILPPTNTKLSTNASAKVQSPKRTSPRLKTTMKTRASSNVL